MWRYSKSVDFFYLNSTFIYRVFKVFFQKLVLLVYFFYCNYVYKYKHVLNPRLILYKKKITTMNKKLKMPKLISIEAKWGAKKVFKDEKNVF